MKKKIIANHDWNVVFSGESANGMWQKLKSILHAGLKKFVWTQKRTDGRVRTQRLTYKVVKSSKRKRNAWRNYQQVPTRENYEKYKNHSNIATKVIRYQKKKKQLEKRICKNIKKDPKAFYKYVKQKMKVRDDITKMKINESSTSCDELELAESLNSYFPSIFTTKDRTHIPNLKENRYIYFRKQSGKSDTNHKKRSKKFDAQL